MAAVLVTAACGSDDQAPPGDGGQDEAVGDLAGSVDLTPDDFFAPFQSDGGGTVDGSPLMTQDGSVAVCIPAGHVCASNETCCPAGCIDLMGGTLCP